MTTGPAAAAVLAAGIGLLALAVAQVASAASSAFRASMQALGNLWMPGAAGIGPYSGKETVALLAWLLTWFVLHRLLRQRDVSLVAAGTIALLFIGLATTLLWPPVTDWLAHHLA